MASIEKISMAIDYIEANLTEKIDLNADTAEPLKPSSSKTAFILDVARK